MPRVESGAEVTLVVLVYRSLKWLDWCMQGVDSSRQVTRYRWLVVSNDGTEEIRRDPRISVDFQNANPSEHYISRIYRAWQEGILAATTQWVILLNSDMVGASYWVDELVKIKRAFPKSLPTSLLIESGRIPSGMPEFVRDLGTTPETFRRQEFLQYAAELRRPGKTEPGRLYMPVLFDRQEYFDLGGYPPGNVGGISGDRILFDKYLDAGFDWVTCHGSVVWHAQEGEMRDA